MRIEDLIPIGQKNAIHLEELAAAANTDERTARKLVHNAREQGAQILSGNDGYWIAENDFEKRKFVSMMQKHAISHFRSVKAIRDSINDSDGVTSPSRALNKPGQAARQ